MLFLNLLGSDIMDPEEFLAVGTGSKVQVFNLIPGGHHLQVTAMDLAGNSSRALPLPKVVIPLAVSGCSLSAKRGHASGFLRLFAHLLFLAFIRITTFRYKAIRC